MGWPVCRTRAGAAIRGATRRFLARRVVWPPKLPKDFRFVPFIAFVIPLHSLCQRLGPYNTHTRLILAYQLIIPPFTIGMPRCFFQEIPLEIQEAAKIDGCSWLGVP